VKKIEEATRERVAKLIPKVADKVLRNYQDMVNAGVQNYDDTKKAKAYYEACKAAAAHLQFILKIAEWAEVAPNDNGLQMQEIQRYLMEAKAKEEEWQAAYKDDEGELV
jgi:hypothetical protein